MDVVGSEIGQKMRSAIKAKLTELGCYVDDELPDYVMVMVANKRTRSQMEDDLQLFLGGNTDLFVNWLHQVLKKLQEVTVNTAIKQNEKDDKGIKTKSGKEHKEKKDKSKDKHKKSDSSKKAKKVAKKKEKLHRKKLSKSHKSKKKSKDCDIIRPNVPPLLMNLEKESEPSITDVFAGQILKNHGITMESTNEDQEVIETKPVRKALKRNRFPIIDPETVSIVPDIEEITVDPEVAEAREEVVLEVLEVPDSGAVEPIASLPPRDEQIKEMNEIEVKIQGLKKKLADQLDSMSEDEDFLNIRTEAEELMNDFAEDVLQEITATQCTNTPPLRPPVQRPIVKPDPAPYTPVVKVQLVPEQLPQIELQLPKRPMRERLGARSEPAKVSQPQKQTSLDKRKESPERFTPEREPEPVEKQRTSVKSRLGESTESSHRRQEPLPERVGESSSKRLPSKVSVLDVRETRAGPASVVRVRPRLRPTSNAPASNLLLRAVADAHKSLLNIPPKVESEPSKIKRALVLPMRRGVEVHKIVIQVPSESVLSASPMRDQSDCEIDFDTESLADLESDADNKSSRNSNEVSRDGEQGRETITRKLINKKYVITQSGKNGSRKNEENLSLEEDTITIHNPTVGNEKGPQFVVTLDGLDPNVFLAKKLKTEGIIDDEDSIDSPKTKSITPDITEKVTNEKKSEKIPKASKELLQHVNKISNDKKSVVLETEEIVAPKPKAEVKKKPAKVGEVRLGVSLPARKRKASPIVFNVTEKKENAEKRERKESVSSDTTVTTSSSKKYDSLPSLPPEKKSLPCRTFPVCRFGSACAFSHPLCKFAASCTRRNCIYSHPMPPIAAKVSPVVASHVVPVPNYQSVSTVGLPSICRFYPNCVNPACHFYHPKACRFGPACLNKLECNFYHHELPATVHKWRSPFKV